MDKYIKKYNKELDLYVEVRFEKYLIDYHSLISTKISQR